MKNFNKICWNDLFKVKIASSDKSMEKHEIIKTLIVMKLMNKHSGKKSWIRIYTEFPIDKLNRKCDVYFENLKKREVMIYEIQKRVTKQWEKSAIKDYNNLELPFMEKTDFHIIKVDDFSDDINELSKELDMFIN